MFFKLIMFEGGQLSKHYWQKFRLHLHSYTCISLCNNWWRLWKERFCILFDA